MIALPDCRRCGACCCNRDENIAEGHAWYIDIGDDCSLLKKKALVQKHVVEDAEGQPWLKMNPDGRCSALAGSLGRFVTCRIYGDRPQGCRRIQPGDPECLAARRERGLER